MVRLYRRSCGAYWKVFFSSGLTVVSPGGVFGEDGGEGGEGGEGPPEAVEGNEGLFFYYLLYRSIYIR